MDQKQRGGVMYCGFSAKKEDDDIPVDACKGWTDPCEFCDKRFCAWEEASEEVLAKVPQKPGLFQVAFRSKAIVEIVDIVLDPHDISKSAYNRYDVAKKSVADKKSKFTKSVILCRWMAIKNTSDKDVIVLCAHWFNSSVLPKFLQSWPGHELLQKTENLIYSDYLQKWCYPKKEAFWRKPKALLTKIVQLIESCNWTESCEYCDRHFSKWQKVDDVIKNDTAPDALGMYILSVRFGKQREVVEICFDHSNIKLNIRDCIARYAKSMHYALRNSKFANKNAHFEVRWAEFTDAESENCCYYYAHFLNADTMPMMNHRLPGQEVLEKNKNFVVRTHDKKWCLEVDTTKANHNRISKSKAKKDIENDLVDDVENLNVVDHEL